MVGSAGVSAFTSARYPSARRRSRSSVARCAGVAAARSARSPAISAGPAVHACVRYHVVSFRTVSDQGSELAGRVAIVTGGGQGIGRATALELARLGADVVVAELNAEGAERTAKEVRGVGAKALAL